MTKTILMLGAAALVAAATATPSLAKSRHHHAARQAYAEANTGQNFGVAAGCQSHCGPARAAAFWRPGMCWVDQDRLRRLGYFAPCKK